MKRIAALMLCIVLLLPMAVPVSANTQTGIDKQALYSALYEADISSLKEALQLGLITCEELTKFYLYRIEQYNKPYNCFITLCDDALEIARNRDAQLAEGKGEGLLFGIPVVIKDNMDLDGYHTTNGYKKKDEQIASSNADVVEYLLNEGAVIIGKTNMSTGAQDALRSHSQAVGETKNAYSTYLASGGSSGGTAVAVSLNFATVGLGTDTNSSLRIPAALNGCVSLRPTFGLLSQNGIKKLNKTRDTAGAITRTVYDQALMLDVLTQGKFGYTKNLNGNVLQGLRIGVLKQLSYATTKTGLRSDANIDDEVAAAFEKAIDELRDCGAEVIEISMPKLFSLSDPTLKNNKQELKDTLYDAFKDLLEKENVSAVIYPAYLSTPIRSGKDAEGKVWNAYDQTNINNCRAISPSAGVPEISVPIGNHSLGAGIGMEIAALKNQEQLLLDIAYAYTSRYDHRMLPEGVPDAYSAHNQGTLVAVIDTYLQQLEESTKPTETTQPAATEQAQIPQPQPRKTSYGLYIALGVLVVLVLCALLILSGIPKKRRRRRKMPALILEDPDG